MDKWAYRFILGCVRVSVCACHKGMMGIQVYSGVHVCECVHVCVRMCHKGMMGIQVYSAGRVCVCARVCHE